MANSVETHQMQRSATSDPSQCCLIRTVPCVRLPRKELRKGFTLAIDTTLYERVVQKVLSLIGFLSFIQGIF